MFNASPSAVTVVPIDPELEKTSESPVTVYKSYGDIPFDRLKVAEPAVFFWGDAQFRSKIGVNPRATLGRFGSYDSHSRVLTLIQFNQPRRTTDYVNSLWGRQDHLYGGDAINSYNDGPPAPASWADSLSWSLPHLQRHWRRDRASLTSIEPSTYRVRKKNSMPRYRLSWASRWLRSKRIFRKRAYGSHIDSCPS